MTESREFTAGEDWRGDAQLRWQRNAQHTIIFDHRRVHRRTRESEYLDLHRSGALERSAFDRFCARGGLLSA